MPRTVLGDARLLVYTIARRLVRLVVMDNVVTLVEAGVLILAQGLGVLVARQLVL